MKKAAESTPTPNASHHQEESKVISSFHLPALIQQLKEEESWAKRGRGAKTLYKSDSMRIVLNVMQTGTEIKTHQAAGPISVHVVEGRINFTTEETPVVLQKGDILALKEYIRHSVEALEETAFVLTVAPL